MIKKLVILSVIALNVFLLSACGADVTRDDFLTLFNAFDTENDSVYDLSNDIENITNLESNGTFIMVIEDDGDIKMFIHDSPYVIIEMVIYAEVDRNDILVHGIDIFYISIDDAAEIYYTGEFDSYYVLDDLTMEEFIVSISKLGSEDIRWLLRQVGFNELN